MYLLQNDFKRAIQSDNLNQIVGNDTSILNAAMQTAEEEIKSYLVQKYNTTQEFTDTSIWDYTKAYKAGDRFYLDAPAYNPLQAAYNLHDLTLQAGNVYINTTAIAAPEAFNNAHWTLLGKQYSLFYGSYPKPPFQYNNGNYSIGSQVYYNGNVYTALRASLLPSYDGIIQGDIMPVAPYANYFPDDTTNGATYWGTGTPYSIAANTLPANTLYYTAGDNRSQQLLTYMIDIALYHIHSRIAPRNIPELRVKRYDDALSWLKRAASGEITANLPALQPASGARIRWASHPKQRNNY